MRPEPTWEELEARYEFIWPCHWCGSKLDPRYDYFCPRCHKQSCDRCNQACQAENCDEVMCGGCVSEHMLVAHSGAEEW